MSSFTHKLVQICFVATALIGAPAFASEFDPKDDGKAPEAIVIREDSQGHRVAITVDKAPAKLKSEADLKLLAVAAANADKSHLVIPSPGAEGSHPSEFDKTTGTAAWHYWGGYRGGYGGGYRGNYGGYYGGYGYGYPYGNSYGYGYGYPSYGYSGYPFYNYNYSYGNYSYYPVSYYPSYGGYNYYYYYRNPCW